MPTEIKTKVHDLREFMECHYPKEKVFTNMEMIYTRIPAVVGQQLQDMVPNTEVFNKVLWILAVDHEEDTAAGVYQHDDYYYLVTIKEKTNGHKRD